MMNCHYISAQLARIQQAKVGAEERGSPLGDRMDSRSNSGPSR
jgi:hypothetical protein